MDLTAYANIESLEGILKDINIEIPRLRGIRLMKYEDPYPEKFITELFNESEYDGAESACRAEPDYAINPWGYSWGFHSDKKVKKYLNENTHVVRWDRLHGYKRKAVKYHIRHLKKNIKRNVNMFNKYVGRDDIVYIHARLGSWNWSNFHGDDLKYHPVYLEHCDDWNDKSYCDIYLKVNPEIIRKYEVNNENRN